MRYMYFAKNWPKLTTGEDFTTFRYPIPDDDWYINEKVVVARQLTGLKQLVLGTAKVKKKELRRPFYHSSRLHFLDWPPCISRDEALTDGFGSLVEMLDWLEHHYPEKFNPTIKLIHKLTLHWIRRAIS